ncbi:MAG: hypothetical protein N2691_01270 [Patescibacteria group bacterium]|nr:hypothetical protein [Patescibacteria group bacterium]
MYSDLYIKRPRFGRTKRIMLLVFALACVTGIGIYFMLYTPRTRASESDLISHEVVNINRNQFGVFWKTGSPSAGSIVYGDSPSTLSRVVYDERDPAGQGKPFQSHLVLVSDLEPGKTYYYALVSGSTWIMNDDGNPFAVTLPKNAPLGAFPQPAYGKVTIESGIPVDTGIIVLRKGDAYPLAVRTRRTGEWLMPLQNIYSSKTNEPTGVGKEEIITLEIVDATLRTSRIKAKANMLSPLPETIIIGKDYSFIDEGAVLSAFSGESKRSTGETDILFPKEGAIIPSGRPLIRGIAVPGMRVTVMISSDPEIRLETRADEDGKWHVSLAKPLPPGEYFLKMNTLRADEEPVERVRTFTITKSGEQVLGDATGSASPAPASPSPSPEPTKEPASKPSPLPTDLPEIEPSPSLPVSTPVPATPSAELLVPISEVSPSPALMGPTGTPIPPVPGGNSTTFTLISLGLFIVGAGALLLL